MGIGSMDDDPTLVARRVPARREEDRDTCNDLDLIYDECFTLIFRDYDHDF